MYTHREDCVMRSRERAAVLRPARGPDSQSPSSPTRSRPLTPWADFQLPDCDVTHFCHLNKNYKTKWNFLYSTLTNDTFSAWRSELRDSDKLPISPGEPRGCGLMILYLLSSLLSQFAEHVLCTALLGILKHITMHSWETKEVIKA